MTRNILYKYSCSPYVINGLDFSKQYKLKLLYDKNSNRIKRVFYDPNDCENFILKQTNDEKIVLIISGHLSNDSLIQLQNHSQIDSIYLYNKSDDSKDEFTCVYKTTEKGRYTELLIDILENFWFIISLGFVVILAYLFPDIGASNGPLYAEYSVKRGVVFLTFLFCSLTIPTKNLLEEIRNIRLHLCIQIFSLILYPFIVFDIVLLLTQTSMNKFLLYGMILMGCTPAAITISIIATEKAGGNECGTLLNGLFSHLIGIFTSPVLISLSMQILDPTGIHQSYDIQNYFRVIANLSLTVLLPFIAGQIINFIWTDFMMWAKAKFHFTKVISVGLLIILWTTTSDLFQSDLLETINKIDLLIIIILNASFFIIFTLLTLFIARLPNIFICRKTEMQQDHQPLLLEQQSKSLTAIQRWRFSREDTITFLFCSVTKAAALGLLLATFFYTGYSHGELGLISLPLILYHIEQLILCSIVAILLQYFVPPKTNVNI